MKSIWQENTSTEKRGELKEDIRADAVIIGGGMCGILCAYFLKEAGANVVVLEADEICSGQTGRSTAKITFQHGLMFNKLEQDLGKFKAQSYIELQKNALMRYERLIKDKNLDCDYKKRLSCVYSLEDERKMIKEEKSAQELGVDAYFSLDTELPFKVKGAVYVKNAAVFNPVKFAKGISEEIKIYENSPVTGVKGNVVYTKNACVKAKTIIFCCHYPFINFPGMHFTKLYQSRSYAMALAGEYALGAAYIDESGEGLSLRDYPGGLILGGGAHRTGFPGGGFKTLEEARREYFADFTEEARWSAQDIITPDGLPYVGIYSLTTPSRFLATGFNKWGMTGSMAAAAVICDMLIKGKSDFEEMLSPARKNLKTVKRFFQMSAQAAKSIALSAFYLPKETADLLNKNEGRLINVDGRKVGAYNDAKRIYLVSPKCPHLGCELHFNQNTLSWDCPCHGSRFSYTGELLEGPAQTNIKMQG